MKAKLQLGGKKSTTSVDFQQPDGEPVKVLLRPITQLEEAESIAFAKKFAVDKGESEPDYGAALFDLALRAHVLLVATLDADSPEEARERFFPSVEYILAHYHPDALAHLHQRWSEWQEQTSPFVRIKGPAELKALIVKLAAEEGDDFAFFSQLSPRTRAHCMRFTAQLALTSPALKSIASSPTEN